LKGEREEGYLEGAVPYPPDVIRKYTERGWWLNMTFGDVLDRSSGRYPEKIAVIDERIRLTYAQLKERVDRFALALLKLGVGKYDRMLIQLPNRYEFLVAFYGMQRIGAVPVLAVPRHGAREISHFLQVMQPMGWILPLRDGNREFEPLIERVKPGSHGVELLIMVGEDPDVPPDLLSMEALVNQGDLGKPSHDYLARFRPDPNDVALILLTGGTTGMPKGVPRTHNGYLANIRYTNEDTRPEDVRGLATPIGHSMAHQGPVGGSVYFGATLCLIALPRSEPILKAIEKNRITMISLVPTQLEDILNDPRRDSYDLSSLRKVRTAGAALRPETTRRAQEFFGKCGADFVGGGFGSSEGPCATHRPGEPPDVFLHSIGRPMCEGDHWKVIDEQERQLPPDTEGELVARGPCVFTGYYRSETENREIFTQDGYYKMGDLGRIDREGHIFITGRRKDIIQRGGEGIIPHEIEALLYLHPSVASAAVVAMPDPRLGEKACAYVTLEAGATLSFDHMVDFLKAQGAGVLQIPERLEIVENLPKTTVGKIDKKTLREDIAARLRKEGALVFASP
jgi:non-ribosomal peptide synthetase component E (peptide arylation enzyme)